MSDDLVSRLREPLSQLPGDDDTLMERVVSDRDEAAQALTEARAEIERLRGDLVNERRVVTAQSEARVAAESELSTLRARVREVVGPFAEAAADICEQSSDDAHIWESPCAMNITRGHLRAARQLMEEVK